MSPITYIKLSNNINGHFCGLLEDNDNMNSHFYGSLEDNDHPLYAAVITHCREYHVRQCDMIFGEYPLISLLSLMSQYVQVSCMTLFSPLCSVKG